MDQTTILAYLTGIIIIFLLGRIFIIPIKLIFKLILNSILGGILIFIINSVGAIWNFHIGLNIITAIFVGILGIPRKYSTRFIKIITRIKENQVKLLLLSFEIITNKNNLLNNSKMP